MRHPALGTALLVAALATGAVVAGSHGPRPAPTQAAGLVEVVGAEVVCPDLTRGPGLTTRVSVGAGPLPAGRAAGPGTVEARRVSATGAGRPLAVTRPGEVTVGVGDGLSRDGLVVTASGSLAAGVETEQVTRGEKGLERGLAGLRCEPPRTDAWFEGGSTQVGDRAVLVLADVDDAPALVDVSVFSTHGPVDVRPGQGITVRPHSRLVVDLATLAPDRSGLAVHVQTRRGRVAAAVRQTRSARRVPYGVDWLPPGVPPAQKVLVPGVPQGPGSRSLLVSNPGTDDAVVRVQVTSADGQFVPTGLAQLDVPAGTTVVRRIDRLAASSALALTVTSDRAPVLAGVQVIDRQTGPVQETAYTAAALPLSGPALITDLVIDRPTESTLIVTAPMGAARVVVTPLRILGLRGSASLPPAPKTVSVAAGRTATLRLSTFFPPGTAARLAVEIRTLPGSGPVYAARYLRSRGTDGPLTTLLALAGPAQQVERPIVVRDPSLGAGR